MPRRTVFLVLEMAPDVRRQVGMEDSLTEAQRVAEEMGRNPPRPGVRYEVEENYVFEPGAPHDRSENAEP